MTDITYQILKSDQTYKIQALNNIKEVGSFDINLVTINQKCYGKRIIPSMSIEVNEYYQKNGIAKQMIKLLLESFTATEIKKTGVLYIDTDASPYDESKKKTVWDKLGLRIDRSFGYEKSVLINELYKSVSK